VAKGKYTRKQLRKPDEFISLWMRVWDVIRENGPKVIVMVVVAVLIIAGVWTYSYFAEARAAKATAKLSRGIEIYNQTIIPMETEVPEAPEDDIPRFKSRKAKLEAAEEAFGKAMKSAGGNLADVALLMRASVRYDEGRYKEAIEDYRKYLGSTENARLRQTAVEGMGYAYEAMKDYDNALQFFRKLATTGKDGKSLANYHEARILAKQGNKDKAAELLQQIIEKSESQSLQDRASDQLAQIEAE
jgi:tetratricopeptide (TPR) repeat protein